MLLMTIRKMLSNKWMLICTLLGAIITVAMLSSIPIYTEGIMQRMLTKDLENFQVESGKYTGGYLIKTVYNPSIKNEKGNAYENFNGKISDVLAPSVQLPITSKATLISAFMTRIVKNDNNKVINTKVSSLSDMQEHIKILHGRMYSNRKIDGVYEVIVSEEAMKVLNLTLNKTYDLARYEIFEDIDALKKTKIRIVGIFTYKEQNDPYWFKSIEIYRETLFMDPSLLMDEFIVDASTGLDYVNWFFAYDYHKVKLENVPFLIKTFSEHKKWFERYRGSLEYEELPIMSILEQYNEREKQLKITLLVLQIPILLMLAFYSFMISKLKIDYESNEIAVIKSRGGSGSLIFMIFLLESLIIGVIAMIIGPVIGLLLCKILGASNGFMEFVQRKALPLSLSLKAYTYSGMAILFISVSMLIPAFSASRTSIVLYKQKRSRGKNTSFWKRYFLDVVLLAVSVYGMYGYRRQQNFLFLSGVKGTDLVMDPLLFLVSTLFILGSGLFILRIFPYFIRMLFWLGKKIWSPVFYASFIQVGRTSGQEQFVMIFLILTISIGTFNSNSARTINKNIEEKVRYDIGADIAVKSHWKDNKPPQTGMQGPGMQAAIKQPSELLYFEPPFEPFTKLKGVEAVTKVFKESKANILVNEEWQDNVSLMGIMPNEFGKIAWFRNDLLRYHWYQYLNLMTESPTAVLVSKAFKDKLHAKEGDPIFIRWGENSYINGTIYAFVDYWPTLNPHKKIEDKQAPYFVVANLSYMHAMLSIEPYEVWMKKAPGATSNEVYKSIEDYEIKLDSRFDATEQIIKRKNDPLLQGTNGSLSLGFLVTIIISIIGFLIYWILSIRKRALQFGIFRAMGLSTEKIFGMLAIEQVLITGTSIATGILVGSYTSKIFVPMLQMVYGTEEQVPPFKVISYMGDYIKLYGFIGLMLICGFVALWRIVAKLNISSALKLGED